jgi:hypothetical protein
MPRVLVTTDNSARQILMDEQVDAAHLDTEYSAEQLIERLAWSLCDAAQAETDLKSALGPRAYREVTD